MASAYAPAPACTGGLGGFQGLRPHPSHRHLRMICAPCLPCLPYLPALLALLALLAGLTCLHKPRSLCACTPSLIASASECYPEAAAAGRKSCCSMSALVLCRPCWVAPALGHGGVSSRPRRRTTWRTCGRASRHCAQPPGRPLQVLKLRGARSVALLGTRAGEGAHAVWAWCKGLPCARSLCPAARVLSPSVRPCSPCPCALGPFRRCPPHLLTSSCLCRGCCSACSPPAPAGLCGSALSCGGRATAAHWHSLSTVPSASFLPASPEDPVACGRAFFAALEAFPPRITRFRLFPAAETDDVRPALSSCLTTSLAQQESLQAAPWQGALSFTSVPLVPGPGPRTGAMAWDSGCRERPSSAGAPQPDLTRFLACGRSLRPSTAS